MLRYGSLAVPRWAAARHHAGGPWAALSTPVALWHPAAQTRLPSQGQRAFGEAGEGCAPGLGENGLGTRSKALAAGEAAC